MALRGRLLQNWWWLSPRTSVPKSTACPIPEPATMGVVGGLGLLVMMIRRPPRLSFAGSFKKKARVYPALFCVYGFEQ